MLYSGYRYVLITYVILEYTAAPTQNAEHQEHRAHAHPSPNHAQERAPEAPHKRRISRPILYMPQPPSPATRTTELYTAAQLPTLLYINI